MIKKTLHIGNPVYLSTSREQLCLQSKDSTQPPQHVPIEDIGILVLEHPHITITQAAMAKLLEYNVAITFCNQKYLPIGISIPLQNHWIQSARFRHQLYASEALRKQLWAQTVAAKIQNQANLLQQQQLPPEEVNYLRSMTQLIRAGDSSNIEARAAAYYWKRVFRKYIPDFQRDRNGTSPNTWLNYGYAIVRACAARALTGVGLLPLLGIHHQNQYNDYCLADDLMEPYRPFVDKLVLQLIAQGETLQQENISQAQKKQLLQLPVIDVKWGNKKSPLLVAIQHSATALAHCFEGKKRKLRYPQL